MFARLKRKKILLLFLIVVLGLAVFSCFSSPSGYSFYYFQKFQDRIAPLHGALARLQSKFSFNNGREKAQLREENAQLRQRLIALEEEKKTWEGWQRLRGELFSDLPRGIAAQVISVDASAQRQSVTLDKGSLGGIHEGQVVLGQGGLVGRITHVSEKTSQVLLLTDPFSVVDVLAQSSRIRGTLKGGRNTTSLGGEYFLVRDGLREGDLLLTSGQDGIFPKGIPVGVVRNLQKDESGIFYRAQVEPVVEMRKLEVVEVL
jgi:rod shape-determining protein MreC